MYLDFYDFLIIGLFITLILAGIILDLKESEIENLEKQLNTQQYYVCTCCKEGVDESD